MRCAVFGCNNSNQGKNKTDISMYHFPKNLKTQKKWLSLICRKDKINTKNARVCAAHFTKEDFQRDELMASLNLGEVLLNKLKVDAVPSKNMPRQKNETAVGLARQSRAQKRNDKASSNYQNSATNLVELHLEELIESQDIVQTTETDHVQPAVHSQGTQTAATACIEPATTTEYLDCIWCGGEIPHTCGVKPYQKLQQSGSTPIKDSPHVALLKKRIMELKRRNRIITAKNAKRDVMFNSLQGIFTPGQIKRLQSPGKRPNWTADDIASMRLRCIRPVQEHNGRF